MGRRLRPGADAVSPVVATLLLLSITLVLAATVFGVALWVKLQAGSATPVFAFDAAPTNGTIRILQAPPGTPWETLRVSGCATVPTGFVRADDVLAGCSGTVTIVDAENNRLIARFQFP